MPLKDKYYRKITESLPQDFKKNIKKAHTFVKPGLKKDNLLHHWSQYAILFLAMLFVFSAYLVAAFYFSYEESRREYLSVVREYSYWENVVSKHPNFPDGYYNASIYALKLNKKDRALELIQKAVALDPEFKEASDLVAKIR